MKRTIATLTGILLSTTLYAKHPDLAKKIPSTLSPKPVVTTYTGTIFGYTYHVEEKNDKANDTVETKIAFCKSPSRKITVWDTRTSQGKQKDILTGIFDNLYDEKYRETCLDATMQRNSQYLPTCNEEQRTEIMMLLHALFTKEPTMQVGKYYP